MVRMVFFALWLALLLFLHFPSLLFIYSAKFEADCALLPSNFDVLHSIQEWMAAGSYSALLSKLRSSALAIDPCLARLQRHRKQKTRKRQQECIAQ